MKKNGFTLIELLAVIVVLGILGLIIIPNIAGTLKNQKNNLYDIQIKNIEEAARGWAGEHFYSLPTIDNGVKSIYLKDLADFIDTNINNPKTNKNFGKCLRIDITKVAGAESYTYKVDESTVDNDDGCEQGGSGSKQYTDSILQGNDPNLLNNSLTPVVYDESKASWVVADTSKEWYNYSKQEWANAVILNSGVTKSVGDTVVVPTDSSSTSEVKAMLVWIPRYEYHIEGTYGTHLDGTAGTKTLPGQIEVKFIPKSQTTADSNYILHPAFTWDDNSDGTIATSEHISGIWVGKFETTRSSSSPTILPNVTSIRSQRVVTLFNMGLVFKSYLMDSDNTDSHMMKNSEWGAVAYLSQSIYGKYGNTNYTGANKEIYKNDSSSYYTGRSSGTYPQSGSSASGTCLYNNITDRGNGTGSCGGGASTTGNITGIYDMSGGAWEYVMGYLTTSTSALSGAGFSSAPASKYYDAYTSTKISTACNGGICYGYALSETFGWYSDTAYTTFISTASPWLLRGGNVTGTSTVGIFSLYDFTGAMGSSYSFRSVILMAKENSTSILYGDINEDGKIDEDDYLLLYRHSMTPDIYPISDTAKIAGDLNGDGELNIDDALILKKYIDGEISTIPLTE